MEAQNSFGRVAVKKGFITEEQLEEAVKVQAAAAKAGFRKRLGDILVKKGYLTTEQVQKILRGQTTTDKSRRIGDYELKSKLGEGAMGAVFLARQTLLGRDVAIKILPAKLAKDQDFRGRFVREARAVAKLNHPNIVAGIDVGEVHGIFYFAMEYVEGDTLGGLQERNGGTIPEKEALEYIRQTALALHHAHTHGLLHRDVKPDNVLVDKDGTAKLADLGLARSARVDEDAALTQAGMAVGTPYYISPEQARGESDLTPGTDLYSLGATLYHLLTGEPPFNGTSGAVIMAKHVTDEPPDPRDVNPDISAGAARICLKLMQKDPKDRYKDGNLVAEELRKVIEGTASREGPVTAAREAGSRNQVKPVQAAGGGTSVYPARPPRKRHSASIVGPLIFGAVFVVGAFVAWKVIPRGGDDSPSNSNRPDKQTPIPQAPVVLPAKAPPDPVKPKPSEVLPEKPSQKPVTPTTKDPVDAPEPVKLPGKPSAEEQHDIEVKLLEALQGALKGEQYADARKAVQAYKDKNGEPLAAAVADRAIDVMEKLSKQWSEGHKGLQGKPLALVNAKGVKENGTISEAKDDGFVFQLKGNEPARPLKWTQIDPSERMNLLGVEKGEPRALYVYFAGDALDGPLEMVQSAEAGMLLPDSWREQLIIQKEAAVQAAQKAEVEAAKAAVLRLIADKNWLGVKTALGDFEQKFQNNAADLADLKAKFEEAKPAVKAPEKPPEKKGLEALLNIKPNGSERTMVELVYDFHDAEQLKDFAVSGGSAELKDGALLFSAKADTAFLTHKIRWAKNNDFTIQISFSFVGDSSAAGLLYRETPDGSPVDKKYINFQLGANERLALAGTPKGTTGVRMFYTGGQKNKNNTAAWANTPGESLRVVMAHEPDFWSGKINNNKLDSLKHSLINEAWAGHAGIFASNAVMSIKQIRITGFIDPDWFKEASGGK